ncbi:MAG: heat-shock protein Hsp20 [Desulfobacterales bacterium S3730MH5]|nr:MAG: heat-shock protein Hsp20 [Desulfobacterales bacterium S3730MH5]OEU79087.1 MAG: heat-shock protein Hsp20 [Desulfobacterales bacterium S5133MH4]
MADTENKAMQAKGKMETTMPAEQTKAGLTFRPPMDIFETDEEITVLADVPGVKTKDLDIDLRDDVLTVSGDVESPEGPNEAGVLREYQTGGYFRQFTLSHQINQSKIDAELQDGVLRLRLPMIEAATPRKVNVKSG